MTDHPSPRTLREYLCGQLAPGQMLTVSDHLAACADCRRALAATDDGPGYEQLAEAVDGILDPAAREDLAAHLADCPVAAAELADLERFKREMAPQAGRIYGPQSPGLPGAVEPRKILVPPLHTWRSRRSVWFPAAAAAVVLLAGGGWWTLRAPHAGPDVSLLLTTRNGQHADYTALPDDLRTGIIRALRDGRLEITPPVPGLRPHAGQLAGSDAPVASGFRVLAPVGVVVRAARPVLRWTPCPAATGYVVTATSLDGADTRNSPVLPATETSWTPPEPLVSGALYRWQVEGTDGSETLAYTPAPPAAEARFQVLDEAARAKLAQVEARFGAFPLVMAVAFAQAGLEEAATAQTALLINEHPDSPALRNLVRGQATAPQSPSPITTKGAQ